MVFDQIYCLFKLKLNLEKKLNNKKNAMLLYIFKRIEK